jgi:pimeloyl-ACP methyl ester carboxylesterase
LVLFLATCLLHATALRADEIGQPRLRRDPHRPAHLLVVLIGGIDSDPTPAQIAATAARNEGNSGLYRFAGDISEARVLPEYFNWNGSRAGKIKAKDPPGSRGIAEFIRRHLQEFPGDRVALVGNSWGGHTALEVLQQLHEGEAPLALHLVAFLDASSTGRGPVKPKALPLNVNRAVSYYTRSILVWGKWDAGARLENIDLADPANRFIVNGEPPYNAPFDVRGHVAAEWDEEIHSDIKRRLVKLLPQSDDETEQKIEDGR